MATAANRPKTRPRRTTDEDYALRRIKCLIYGPAGQGKTHFLGTASMDERTAPILILDFEGGVLSTLEGLPGYKETWDYMQIRSWADYNKAFERLDKNEEGFRCVAVDSISETHKFALYNIIEKEEDRRKNPDLIEQGDYGTASVQINRLVRSFRDLPMHVFFTAHAKDETDPREGLVKKPMMAGRVAEEVPGMMEVVGYLAWTEDEEGEMKRTLLLQNWPKVRVKVRTPWGKEAPDEIYDPTVTTLLDTLFYEE